MITDTTDSLELRPAKPEDAEVLASMVEQLAKYENLADSISAL